MDFLKNPQRLRAHLALSLDNEKKSVISSGQYSVVLEREIFGALLPLLDGLTSTPALARALAPAHSYPEVIQALVDLQGKGLLTGAERTGQKDEPYWESQGLVAKCARTVALICLEDEDKESSLGTLEAQLSELGIESVQGPADVTVVITPDYLDPRLEGLALAGSWLPLMARGSEVWMGPMFSGAGDQPCFECLAHRLRLHHNPSLDRQRIPALTATATIAAAQAACLVAHWLRGQGDQRLANGLLEIKTDTATMRWHTVVKRPQCRCCGQTKASPGPPVLVDRPLQGTRTVAPEDFLASFEHHVSPITGLVQELRFIGEGALKLYSAPYRAGGTRGSCIHSWKSSLQSAGGKGRTDLQAKASALGEALERYSGSFYDDPPDTVSSLVDLGTEAIHPNQVMLFSQRQYDSGARFSSNLKDAVPEPLDESLPIRWKRLWSLTQRQWKYLPVDMFHYGHLEAGQPRIAIGCSNGMAAGATFEDAVLQGFFELVERDGVAQWWYNRIRCRGVDFDLVDPDFVGRLRDYYGTRGREFWMLDLTSDLGIPVFAAVSANSANGAYPVFGFGSHLDPAVAAVRALTEMNQLQPAFLKQAERADRKFPIGDLSLTSLGLTVTDHNYLMPDPSITSLRLEKPAESPSTGVVAAIESCRERVEKKGFEFLVADLTEPDVGVPVAKVLVPGLRHFWRRFAPGRLYDSPVDDGRLLCRLAEDELNPVVLWS